MRVEEREKKGKEGDEVFVNKSSGGGREIAAAIVRRYSKGLL
jgi:hypothetical protein